jgi:hypothetical protein
VKMPSCRRRYKPRKRDKRRVLVATTAASAASAANAANAAASAHSAHVQPASQAMHPTDKRNADVTVALRRQARVWSCIPESNLMQLPASDQRKLAHRSRIGY